EVGAGLVLEVQEEEEGADLALEVLVLGVVLVLDLQGSDQGRASALLFLETTGEVVCLVVSNNCYRSCVAAGYFKHVVEGAAHSFMGRLDRPDDLFSLHEC
ncbi:uncharacterized protein LOC18440923, partial [Amborella trichopoda]|uniref:uncharacterized protein LOC18440923 n=1 Tax=Amborella trichopoda TaxID=13333 RepID=UPI0005D36C72